MSKDSPRTSVLRDKKPVLPYDYARCMTKGCPLEGTCMRRTPGRETYQTIFAPVASPTCKYYISMEEWG